MGSAKERHDRAGREKVQCRECGMWFHRLDVHVKKHGGTQAYKDKYPNAPLLSETARRKAKADGEEESDGDSTFKFGVARLKERSDLDEYDRRFLPTHDDDWVLGPDEREALEALALAMEDGENVLIVGPPGVGKSTLVKELGAIANQPVRRFAFRGDMRASDLIGKGALVVDEASGQSITQYEDGVLPDAAERGHWLMIDEVDAAPAEVDFVLHPVLEEERCLMLTGKNGGEEVDFHHDFRFIGTANTLGRGDESGQFAGTAPMNEALLDRFHTVIQMNYPEKANEIARIVKRSGIEEGVADKMVAIAQAVREAQSNDTVATSLSPRRLIMWARKAKRMGDVRRASKYTVTNRLESEDAQFVDGLIQRYFGGAV